MSTSSWGFNRCSSKQKHCRGEGKKKPNQLDNDSYGKLCLCQHDRKLHLLKWTLILCTFLESWEGSIIWATRQQFCFSWVTGKKKKKLLMKCPNMQIGQASSSCYHLPSKSVVLNTINLGATLIGHVLQLVMKTVRLRMNWCTVIWKNQGIFLKSWHTKNGIQD